MKNRYPVSLYIMGLGIFLLSIPAASAYEFPPYQGITLKIIGDISESYSNNITFASDEENKVEDFRTMLNLGLDFQYKGKRRSLDFSGRAKSQILEKSSNVRNPSENITLTFNNEFSKYDRIILRNTYAHTREPGRDQGDFDMNECRDYYENSSYNASEIESRCNEFEEEFGRFKGRFDSYSNNVSFSYYRQISDSFNIKSNYVYGQNWSNEEGTNDSRRNTLGLSVNYIHSEATKFSLSYNYQVSDYEVGDDISRQSINFGIGQYISKRLYLDGSIGKVIMSSGNDSISIGATLISEMNETTSASLSYSQGTEISANTDDTFKNWQITGRVTKLLLEDLNGSLSAFYGKGDYSSTDVTDTLLGASFNLSYNFWQSKRGSNLTGNLGYSYSDLDSTDEARKYTRNSINSSITLAF